MNISPELVANALYFTSDLDVLTFTQGDSTQDSISLTLDLCRGDDSHTKIATIFSEVLTYDSTGNVILGGINDLLLPLIKDNENYSLAIYDATENATPLYVNILPCAVRIDVPSDVEFGSRAIYFIKQNFLSMGGSTRTTYLSAQETLHIYRLGYEGRISVRAVYEDEQGSVYIKTLTEDLSEYLGIYAIDTSSSQFVIDGKRLLSYTITFNDIYETAITNKRVTYVVNYDYDCTPTTIRFKNAFGVLESFHFFGTQEKTVKPTRYSAMINGTYQNYKIDNIPTYKVNTSVLNKDKSRLLEDLLQSLYLECETIPIVITDNEMKNSNDRYEVYTASVSWREDKNIPRFTPSYPVRTFDNTFDKTFA